MMNGVEIRSLAEALFNAAKPVLRIDAINTANGQWFRVMEKPNDSRIGPWWFAEYKVLNQWLWDNSKASLYFSRNSGGEIVHVGETGNRLKDRWRLSPAHCYQTKKELSENQLFHSTGWPAIESDYQQNKGEFPYEVRVIGASALREVFKQWSGSPLPTEGESRLLADTAYVKAVEAALRKFRARVRGDVGELFIWNKR